MSASSRLTCQLLLLGAVVFTYFVLFPADLRALLAPAQIAAEFFRSVLELSGAVSTWLYVFAAVCVAAWTVVRVWGRPDGAGS